MRIASITITSNRERIIGDALRSVKSFVDAAIIVDVGVTDGTIDLAREIIGDIYIVKAPDGQSISPMRNSGLDIAHTLGFDWAIMLDTDERINANGIDIKDTLSKCSCDVIVSKDKDRFYKRERFFRLPSKGVFSGHCHERIDWSGCEVGEIQGVTFTELEKTPEEIEARERYVIASKMDEIKLAPHDGRLYFDLACAHDALGEWEKAIAHFVYASDVYEDDDNQTWCLFRAALTCLSVDRIEECINHCMNGLSINASYAELAWLIGVANLDLNKPDQAIFWSRMAIANGMTVEAHPYRIRPVYSFDPALCEGPYETISMAYRMLGDAVRAKEYHDKFEAFSSIRA